MRGPISSLRFVVSNRSVALVVAKYQQRVTVGMFGLCRIYRGRVVASIYVSLCDDFDVVIDDVLARSSLSDYPISVTNMHGAPRAC
jgi:hypothetical protein